MHMFRHIVIVAAVLLGAGCKKTAKEEAPPAAPTTTADAATTAAVIDAAPPPEVKPYTPAADVTEPIRAAVTASDRTVDDRALDAGRHPAEVLTFFRIAPGQKVAELFAGGGYTTELMARTVGDTGKVYAQNTKEILDKFARQPWTERAAKPAMKNVVAVEQPLDAPLPADAKDLDAVLMILTYHDAVWQKVDRAKMNKAIFDALAPGGVYGIVDHSAVADSGDRDAETLHRIDQKVVEKEIAAAGFVLDGQSDVLRNPDDARDWNSSPRQAGERRGTSDRFVLRFVKPKKR
ncbi:MAG TPA: SAM-dependent methyltransferase [Kofleriaceae bacterium]|nr:SAM-dependent methyltransferase [Kofleriaceae bacterium]